MRDDAMNPSDPERRQVDAPGGGLSYTDEGEGDAAAVVMIHGAPGSARDFRWLSPQLPGLRRIRVDLPGFGESAPRPDGHRVAERADAVLELIDALDLERCAVLGHSMGGAVATAVALNAKDRVAACVLLASVGPRVHRGRRHPLTPLFRRLLSARALDPLSARLARASMRVAGFPRVSRAEALLTLRTAVAWSAVEHRARLEVMACPTAVCWCEDDRLVEAEISGELARMVPEGPRMAFATGGHNLQKTQARALGAVLEPWLEERLSSGDHVRTP